MTPQQQDAVKSLHKVIHFHDRKYRYLIARVEHGTPIQKLQALQKLFTMYGFDEAKLRSYGIRPKDPRVDWEAIHAALEVQRMYDFDLRVWQYVGIYITTAHVEFHNYRMSRKAS